MVVKKDVHEVAINPVEFILNGKAKEIYYLKKYPHVPLLADVKVLAKSLTPEERASAHARAQVFFDASKVFVEGFRK